MRASSDSWSLKCPFEFDLKKGSFVDGARIEWFGSSSKQVSRLMNHALDRDFGRVGGMMVCATGQCT